MQFAARATYERITGSPYTGRYRQRLCRQVRPIHRRRDSNRVRRCHLPSFYSSQGRQTSFMDHNTDLIERLHASTPGLAILEVVLALTHGDDPQRSRRRHRAHDAHHQRHLEVVFVGIKVDKATTVVSCRVSFCQGLPRVTFRTLKSTVPSTSLVRRLPLDLIAIPQSKTLLVPPNGELLHVIFYPPTNPAYEASPDPGEKPPCILNVHGGPTGMSTQGLDWKKIYFTSRGWAW
jgi:hypothetical protein